MVPSVHLADATERYRYHHARHGRKAQVVLMDREDHATMIKLYFALKVWVLEKDSASN